MLPKNILTCIGQGVKLLTTVENKVFANATIDMDGKRFLGCKFTRCNLRYEGGECSWDDNTSFSTSCSWEIGGSAARVVKILTRCGAIVPGSVRMTE